MAEPGKPRLLRRNGRWVREDDLGKNKTFKAIMRRVWYLAIPFVGIVCSQDSYIAPQLRADQDTRNREEAALMRVQDSLLAEFRKIEGDGITIEADIDSGYAPQIGLYQEILDSLRTEKGYYDQTLPGMRSRADSLRAVLGELQGYLQQASMDMQARQNSIDSMREVRVAMRDSIQAVSRTLVVMSDTWDRLAHPDNYRKNTALVPGPGSYPNRDALPER